MSLVHLRPRNSEGFDGIIFAAGNDPRHIPRGTDAQAHLHRANVEAIPAFVRAARDAGWSGSFSLEATIRKQRPH
jgi:hypothetical protein